MDSHGEQCSCGGRCSSVSVHQTLDEMDFERGIWSAALDTDLERVGLLLQRGTDPDLRDQTGYTALHYASRAGHLSVCELLLAHGAGVNTQTHGRSHTPTQGRLLRPGAVTQLLLARGQTPAWLTMMGQLHCIRLLSRVMWKCVS